MGAAYAGYSSLKQIFISVIVTTYNWVPALAKVLEGFLNQSYRDFEIIIADDGSSPETANFIQQFQADHPQLQIKHIWQPDTGFRAAQIRNKAVAKACGDYLIFIDGDCIPKASFLTRHAQLAEKNYFVTGNRILLSESFTNTVLQQNFALHHYQFYDWLLLKKASHCNRILPLLFLPYFPRRLKKNKWQGAKTCNLGVWRNDFVNINGFDESFVGWGFEDSDLVIRLFNHGIKRKDGRFAVPVIHLWHKENDRSHEFKNWDRFQLRLQDQQSSATLGLDQYLEEATACLF